MKNRFFFGLSLLICGSLSAQNFQTTLSLSQTDFNHYSIEQSINGEYILAGTLFGPSGNDIHVLRMDASGNVLCEQTLDLSPDDRAMDIIEDNNGEMFVTGYTVASGQEELLVASFDANCSCNNHVAIQGYDYSAGTNIIWSDNANSLFVGGVASANPFAVPLIDSRAVLLEFDQSLGMLNQIDFQGVDAYHASVNDIIETPNGLFVTGSIDDNSPKQAVLALFIDYGFSSFSNISFQSTNSEHVGVSAVYDPGNDRVYLMSNNSAIHNPQISLIDDVSGAPFVSSSYYLELDPSYGQLNAAGFQLMTSVYDPNNLVAVGYFRTHDFGSAPFDNATPWLTEFEATSGTNMQTVLYNSSSTNFHTHGGGVFSTFSGEHPYIFNSEILAERFDGDGYVFLSARDIGGQYSLDVVSTDFLTSNNSCLDSYNWNPMNITEDPVPIQDNGPGLAETQYGPNCNSIACIVSDHCNINTGGGGCVSQNFERAASQTGTDHNHYSIETLGNCDYIIAGTEFKSGDNDIHVMRVDDAGNLVWERFIDLSSDDRALDVAEDGNGNYIVVGYTIANGPEQMYMVKFDPNGNCLGDKVVTSLGRSVATNVIYSQNNGTYIVGGLRASSFTYPLTGTAIVAEFTNSLNQTGARVALQGSAGKHSSINDIVEVPSGFFVTGSIDFNSGWFTAQGVLAAFLTNSLVMTTDLSFHSTNSEHTGVSAVYVAADNRIYLMSNNSVVHNPQISIIGPVTGGTPSVGSHYYLELDPSYGQINAAGFELRESNSSSSNLVAAGYFRTHDFGSAPYDNATAWLTEFDKGSGTHARTVLYNAPSVNFHTHGGGIFSTFSGEHPYIFNQEILTERADGNGYVFLAARDVGSDYAIDIVSTDWVIGSNSCLDSYSWVPQTITATSIGAKDTYPTILTGNMGGACQVENSTYSDYCTVVPKDDGTYTSSELVSEEMTVFPNPTSDVININIPNANATGELVVINALGKVVFSTNVLGDDEPVNFDLSNQQSGLYFVIYTDNSQRMVSKVMKR